jgi:hypothetical protein
LLAETSSSVWGDFTASYVRRKIGLWPLVAKGELCRIDAMIAQLQKDLSQESGRSQNIQAPRAQVAQDVARIN